MLSGTSRGTPWQLRWENRRRSPGFRGQGLGHLVHFFQGTVQCILGYGMGCLVITASDSLSFRR